MNAFFNKQLAYARVPAADPQAAARFAEEALGLVRVDGEIAALRSDARQQTLVFDPMPSSSAIGLELDDEAALERMAECLRFAGYVCERLDTQACLHRRIRSGVVTRGPSDTLVEFVTRLELSARRFYPSRDSGVVGLSAVGLRSRNIERDLVFWTDLIGAEISDRVGDIAYLRLDHAHHRIALYPSERSGLLYVGFRVRTHDDIMRNAYLLQESQVRIVHGPGCETASGRTFVRFLGLDEQMFMLDFAEHEEVAGRRPRQFALDRYALCAWGSPCHDIPELATA